jgi:hypothetical protein
MWKFVTRAKKPPAKISKKDCQEECELHRKPRKWPDCTFLHLLIQSFWVPCQAKISVKKPYYLKLRFVPEYAQNAGFCTIYPRASEGL